MGVEVPHFAQPFSISATGAAVVEQDSAADVAACVYRVAVCPQGYREELPSFGIPQLARTPLPLNLPALESAITFWEPRADLAAAEQLEAASEAVGIELEVS